MADLSVNVTPDTKRVLDFVLGAALGVAVSFGVLENPLHIQDTVTAALAPPPVLNASGFDENARLRDQVFGATRFTQSQNQGSAGNEEYRLKLADTVTAQRDLDTGLVREVPRLAEFGQVDLYGLGAKIRITDGPAIADFTPPIQITVPAESGKLADTATAQVTVLFASGFDELLHVQDGGWADLGSDESLKLSDSVTAALSSGGDLSVSVSQELGHLADTVFASENPEQTSGFDELLHLQDTATTLLNPEQTSSASESAKVADVVTASINPENASGFDELLHVSDSVTVVLNPENASGFDELLHAQDTVTASMVGGGDLSVSVGQETLHLAETVTVLLNPEQTSGFDELLHVQDVATTLLNPEQASGFDELGHLQDVATVLLNPEQASGFDELLHVQDTPTPTLDPEQTSSPSELLHVQDTVTAAMGGLFVTVTQELLHVQDTPSTLLNPENASGFDELLHVQDTATPSLNPEQTSSASELLHVQDVVTAFMTGPGDISIVAGPESAKLADTVIAVLTPLLASGFDESAKLADQISERLNPLQASVTEQVTCADIVYRLPATSTTFVTVSAADRWFHL